LYDQGGHKSWIDKRSSGVDLKIGGGTGGKKAKEKQSQERKLGKSSNSIEKDKEGYKEIKNRQHNH